MATEDLRGQVRRKLAALTGELQRLRFETDRRWDELLARLTERPEEILPEEIFREAGPSSSAGRLEPASAAEAARRLDAASSQVEALNRFLEDCRACAGRVALLVERAGRLEVWKSAGFEAGSGARGTELDGEDPAVRSVRDGTPQRLERGNPISAALGASDARDALLVPFVVREKISGAVYADVAGNSTLDVDGVALRTWIAGLVVDRLARRELVPSPPLRPIAAVPERGARAGGPASMPADDLSAAPIPREEGIAVPAPTAAAAAMGARPAAPSERVPGGPLAPPSEGERRDEARRFARLLASEIKLYNEEEVAQGRARGDLYARLRDDIERGRRLYEERVPADLRSDADYYYEEIVDVLAGGRPETLR
jgi:hypothetical protein